MTERSEGAADEVGVAAKLPTERSEGAADEVGVAAKRPTSVPTCATARSHASYSDMMRIFHLM